ncbi:hypothetical protein NDU88_006439 [Pleurodeles waltl]|uniref:Uncharacterized protein n=1 Tax=Pleurodeles waltl TaxID=8319 RepID=A0AAV7QIQ9_PLEWA|nr:hypothetical protein NDU88_006439 [Pleurodeles waltl]
MGGTRPGPATLHILRSFLRDLRPPDYPFQLSFHFTQKDLIKKNYEIMERIVEDYQIYLRDKKLRKVKRDDLDYKLGRIYTFARKFDNVKVSDTM